MKNPETPRGIGVLFAIRKKITKRYSWFQRISFRFGDGSALQKIGDDDYAVVRTGLFFSKSEKKTIFEGFGFFRPKTDIFGALSYGGRAYLALFLAFCILDDGSPISSLLDAHSLTLFPIVAIPLSTMAASISLRRTNSNVCKLLLYTIATFSFLAPLLPLSNFSRISLQLFFPLISGASIILYLTLLIKRGFLFVSSRLLRRPWRVSLGGTSMRVALFNSTDKHYGN